MPIRKRQRCIIKMFCFFLSLTGVTTFTLKYILAVITKAGRWQPASWLWLPSLMIEKQPCTGWLPLSIEWSSVKREPDHFQTLGLFEDAQNIAPNSQILASLVAACVPPALFTFQLRNYFEGISTQEIGTVG